MAISMRGKIVITVVVLAVVGRLTATNILKDNNEFTTGDVPTTTSMVVVNAPEDMLYKVGVGIADVTGPCVEINLVSIINVFEYRGLLYKEIFLPSDRNKTGLF